MKFHLFNRYGAFIFALGLIEVSTLIPHDVDSMTSGDSYGGPGCFVYCPHLSQFEFIPDAYEHYTQIVNALSQVKANGDMYQRADDLILASLKIVHLSSREEGAHFFKKDKITFFMSDDDDRLKFEYDGKEVEFIFSDNSGLRAMTKILLEARKTRKDYH